MALETLNGKQAPIAASVEGCTGPSEMANMWQNNLSSILNCNTCQESQVQDPDGS